jgi:hypothetical protein
MVCKHIVDRYNIYYIYTPTKINGRIHSTAVLYVHIALIFMQFQVFTFLLVRTGYSKMTAFSTIVLLIAILMFTFHCFFHWFRNINHLTYSVSLSLVKKRPNIVLHLSVSQIINSNKRPRETTILGLFFIIWFFNVLSLIN